MFLDSKIDLSNSFFDAKASSEAFLNTADKKGVLITLNLFKFKKTKEAVKTNSKTFTSSNSDLSKKDSEKLINDKIKTILKKVDPAFFENFIHYIFLPVFNKIFLNQIFMLNIV